MTRWTDFIREWASDHNISYACALSKPEMKDAYWEKYPKKMTKKEQAKIDTQQIARSVAQQKLMEIASKAKNQMKAKAEATKVVKATAQSKAEAAVKALRALKESKSVKEEKAPRKREAANAWVREKRKELRKLSTDDLYERLEEVGFFNQSYEDLKSGVITKDEFEKKKGGMEKFRRGIIQQIIIEEGHQEGKMTDRDGRNLRTNIKAI